MPQQGELQGFINVKIPSSIKSRSFIPWKAWKRQWVVLRRSKFRDGVELLIGRNSHYVVQISVDDTICRTESRTQYYAFGVFPKHNKGRASVYLSGGSETESQKWISTIRKLLKPPLLPVEENEFSVSVIDNFFTRSAGITGLYGTLRITSDQVTIVDPFTSKNKVEWSWTVLCQCHVSSTIAKEDKGHICTIITSRFFQSGIGPIHLFCLDSIKLTEKLKSKGRAFSLLSSSERLTSPKRHHTFSFASMEKSLPSTVYPTPQAAFEKSSFSKSSYLSRRLSKSEGNLLCALKQLDAALYGLFDDGDNCFSEDKVSLHSIEFSGKKCKIAPGILSAGLGLILPTPGGSEGDCESLHEYEKLDGSIDDLTSLPLKDSSFKFSPPRRESGVSIASGVYEEIDDLSINFDFSSLNIVTENDLESSAPPLPPRREQLSKSLNYEDEKNEFTHMLPMPRFLTRFQSKSAGSTPLPSPPSLSRSQTGSSSAEALYQKSSSWNSSDECDYLPMLPSCGFSRYNSKNNFVSQEVIEDQHYIVMASIKST